MEKYSRHLLLREFGKLFTPSVSRIHQGFVLDTFLRRASSTSRYICTKFGIYLPENLFKHALVLQRQSIFRYTGITFLSTRNPIQEACANTKRTNRLSIHRNCRMPLWLSKRFMGVLSGGEIHCLRRLRKEGSPDFLSRS